jgi:mono/diheme cytochrome c family protein
MLPALMTRPSLRTAPLAIAVAAVALLASGCGETSIRVAKSNPLYEGAKIFNQRCGGCHTFDTAGTEGSATKPNNREYKDGPNFNVRKEQYPDVLYAIRNGGFSGAIMPQNVVVGQDARDVAQFVATYAGRKAPKAPGVVACEQQPIGTLPAPTATTASASTTTSSTTSSTSASSSSSKKSKKK